MCCDETQRIESGLPVRLGLCGGDCLAAQSVYFDCYSFCSQPNCGDGGKPYAGLVQGSDGNFYGTTYDGGANGVSGHGLQNHAQRHADHAVQLLRSDRMHGRRGPCAGLVQGTDGNFYGTTRRRRNVTAVARSSNHPRRHADHAVQLRRQLTALTLSGLVQGSDGNFYGTTSAAAPTARHGLQNHPRGTLTTLYSFARQPDGAYPTPGWCKAATGTSTGRPTEAGPTACGTVFQITPSGTLTTLYSFCSQSNCADGADPYAGLVQGTDGNFYGTTYSGGSLRHGTVFKITPSGTLTTLHSFADGS